VDFASKALTWLQSDFAAMAAPRVKISYLASLALWCGPAFILLFACYLLVGFDPGRALDPRGLVPFVFGSEFVKAHKAFFLLTSGASLGVWLSFAARDVEIPFKTLTRPEGDLLSARDRLAFVLGLSVMSALLFWTHALNIEIGDLKTLKFEGATAFLIGGFFGLAERALSDSVVKRAASFVSALGGG
jgi:hypothetical protein